MSKDRLKAAFAKVRKAVVAAVAVLVLKWLNSLGVELDNETITVILNAVVVSGIVWAVPNAKPYVDGDDE